MIDHDEQAIRDLVATWLRATRAGDLNTVLDLMSDDVVFMVPGRESFGKAEFAANSKTMAGMQFEGTSDILELHIHGDWAWMRSRLKVIITPPGGQPMIHSGYALGILRKNATGQWQLTRDANLVTAEGR